MRNAWVRRCVGITRSGYIGLFPKFTRVDNVVMVVPQSQTPFVFRKIPANQDEVDGKARFELVGECYVHGIMDGELLGRTEGVIEVI
jgi:hypothetical protein